MKRLKFVLPVLLLIILAGCASTSVTDEITPLSLYRTKRFAGENQVFFIGEGQADNQRQAELLAYEDINNKVYRYLGLEPEPESYRELSTAGTLQRYGLRILEKNAYLIGSEFTYAMVASADRNLLAEDRSADMQKEEEIAQDAVNLVLEGDEYIKANRDVEGIRCYLKSLTLSYGLQYVDDEFSFSAILDEVLSLLDSIELKIESHDSKEASCRLKVTRHDTIIPSRVKNSSIKAVFTSFDSRGSSFEDSSMYLTDDKGYLDFIPRAYNIKNSGTVSFTLDFVNEIALIEKLSPYTADVLRKLIASKVCSFDYEREYTNGAIAICTMCMDARGNVESCQWINDLVVEKYKQEEIDSFSFEYIENEAESEMLERFKKQNPGSNNLVFFQIGVGDVFETRMNVCSVSVEGSVLVYDLQSDSVIYDSGVSYANGFGPSVDEAQDDAYANFVQKMLTLLKAYYV